MPVDSKGIGPGTVIRGKYRIVELLGRGGMGSVYLADHLLLEQKVALKFIAANLEEDSELKVRFRREAQAAALLRHPNLALVFDLDTAEDGTLYIAMEYVDGASLRRVIAQGPLDVDRALRIVREVAEGLGEAHAHGIIHRDVKPENILLDRRTDMPKLLDFGIAAIKWGGDSHATRGLVLSPEYAAPEQWKGLPATQLDGRVDLYALGIILSEMLTGKPCFHADNAAGWVYQHLQVAPTPPSALRSEVRDWPGLDELVLRLLAKDREDRPRDVAEFVRRLDEIRLMPGSAVSAAPGAQAAAPAVATSRTIILPHKTQRIPKQPPRSAAPAMPEAKSVTQLSALSAPTGFFTETNVSRTSFFDGDKVRFEKVQETFNFYRTLVNDEYTFLSQQARLTYYLWVASVALGLVLLVTGIILLFLQKFAAGSISVISTAFVGFIYKIFQQREDYYRSLATAKREHLEYGNHWLLVIQSIDAIQNREERERSQRRLVEVLTAKLGSSGEHAHRRGRTTGKVSTGKVKVKVKE